VGTPLSRELVAYVAITDRDWFDCLRSAGRLDEANFWQPSPSGGFAALQPGEPLLFKLHSPDNFIVGGGFFAYWTRLPVSLAWESFGIKNGATSLLEMHSRVARYRRVKPSWREDYQIGCILLEQPFFFPRDGWIPVPDWHPSIQRGKSYPLVSEPGRALWDRVMLQLKEIGADVRQQAEDVAIARERFGKAFLMRPRLGQGSFRVLVTDAYHRRCAVTGERVLPVLQAAHIRPYTEGGDHRVDNGLLLRSDLHTLFDRGYVTVTERYRVEVSHRLKTEFENGHEYLALHGSEIAVPPDPGSQPAKEFLIWHNENRFVG
jgi:putative restriction endonuclease